MSKYKEQIVKLHSEGKSYRDISLILGCSTGTICYHLDDSQKAKRIIRRAKYYSHPYIKKLEFYKSRIQSDWKSKNTDTWRKKMYNKVENFGRGTKPNFTYEDVIAKFGENPKCYLTGKEIDIFQPSTYNFDHIKPASKGGENTLDNLGICTRDANQAKSDMSILEFQELCKSVLENFGYTINKECEQ